MSMHSSYLHIRSAHTRVSVRARARACTVNHTSLALAASLYLVRCEDSSEDSTRRAIHQRWYRRGILRLRLLRCRVLLL